jgi:hypothetical protein
MKPIVAIALFGAVLVCVLGAQKSNTPRWNNADLQAQYANYNEWYFGGRLPKDVLVTWDDLPMDKGLYVMGKTYEDLAGSKFSISIDTKTNIAMATADLTLEHEMCHVATYAYVRDHNEDPHGNAFNECMMSLAKEGAMKDLW